MATIQPKITNGHKYWYIVESRRVNGKPRPVVIEYLGKADDLLNRLHGLKEFKLKSYAHGHIAALLSLCEKLDICSIINKYSMSQKKYINDKPVRNHLTIGGTLMLAIIARACSPASKSEFADWAKKTSLNYMLSTSLAKVDSQHFWDMMDCMPSDAIEAAESEIIAKVSSMFNLDLDRVLYDTTNYFTYIDTANSKTTIAMRGKNKQKRNDLRQVGLALAVTKKDMIPVYHHSYEGNKSDAKVFESVLANIVDRLTKLGVETASQTVVFDRGVNSKVNFRYVQSLKLNFVGALSCSHHKDIITDAEAALLTLGNDAYYRTRREIWGMDLTAVVVISDKLKIGIIRSIFTSAESCDAAIAKMNAAINNPRAKKKTSDQLRTSINALLKKYKATAYIGFDIREGDKPYIEHWIDYGALAQAEDDAGFRIIVTSRHEWSTSDIVDAYNGLSQIESSIKNMKASQHLSLRPQFHWTNHKIRVHNFCCVIGFLLNTLLYKQVRENAGFSGCMSKFLDILDNIRLGSIIQESDKKGRPRVEFAVEMPDESESSFIRLFKLNDVHKNRPKIKGLSKY